jgi:hypothetical protein
MTKIAVDTGLMGSLAADVAGAASAVADLGGQFAELGLRGADFCGASAPLGEAVGAVLRAWGPVAAACSDDLARLHDALVAVAGVWDQVEADS